MSNFVDFEMDTTDLFILAKLRNQDFDQVVISLAKNKITLKEYKELKEIKTKVESGFPLAYILGKIEFLERVFQLNSHVLVPRPETEEWTSNLVKKLQTKLSNNSRLNIIELATGSGVIGLSLWLEFSLYIETILLSDLSLEALKLAQQNYFNFCTNFSSLAKPKFIQSDLFQDISSLDLSNFKIKKENNLNLFVANLPYLPDSDREDLPALANEPEIALFSGLDGLNLFQRCIQQISDLDLKFDILCFELDPRNIFQAQEMAAKIPYFQAYKCNILKDFMGHSRMLQFDIL
jgi:release factor glutamine methyltransferase